MNSDLDSVQRKFVIRDLSSNKIVISEEGEKQRKGEQTGQRTGFSLPAGELEPSGRYQFEVILMLDNGEEISSLKDFEIADGVSTTLSQGACSKRQSDIFIYKSDAFTSHRKIKYEAYRANSKFRSNVQNKMNKFGDQHHEVSVQNEVLRAKISALKAKSEKQELSDSEVSHGNSLIKKHKVGHKKQQALLASYEEAKLFAYDPFFGNMATTDCRQTVNYISQTTVAQKYQYNSQSILQICHQIDAAKAVLEEAKKDIQELDCSPQ